MHVKRTAAHRPQFGILFCVCVAWESVCACVLCVCRSGEGSGVGERDGRLLQPLIWLAKV